VSMTPVIEFEHRNRVHLQSRLGRIRRQARRHGDNVLQLLAIVGAHDVSLQL